MKQGGRALAAAAVFAAAAGLCHAADGNIFINGQVTNETCTINAGGSGTSSFTLNLPKVSTSAFPTATSTAGRVPFSLAFTGCQNFPVGGGAIYPYFEGSNINGNGRLSIAGGGATNLDIELLNGSGVVMDLSKGSGSQGAGSVTVTNGNGGTLTYYAQYRATAGPNAVGAGLVSTSVTYTIVYP